MKYLKGKSYVEVKYKLFIIHPNEDIILRELKPPKGLQTQGQVLNETKLGRIKKLLKIKMMS